VFDEFIEKNSWQARFSNTDLNDLISLKLIPKILHFVWFSPNGDQLPGDINVNIQKWKNLYPDFLIKVWTEEKLRKFFDPLDSRIMKAIDLCRFEAMKSDIARLAIIHHKGGVYVDLKNKPESDFLYQVIRSNEPVILEHQKTLPIPEGQITNAFLASQSKTQFTALTLEMVIENVLSKVESKGVIDVTGLNVWKKAISQLEVGSVKIIDSDIAWNNTGASKDCYWMSRVSASYNGKNSNNHWSKRQKFESLYV
jgi:mannosyltransferase OCH1-like enzyme